MPATRADGLSVERIQTGVRLEKRLLKVTKALADSLDLTLGDLLEGVLLHALEGKPPFGQATLARAAQLKQVFGLDLTAADAIAYRTPGAAPRAETHMSTPAATVALTADEGAFVAGVPRPARSPTTRSTTATTCGWRGSTCGRTDRARR